MASPPKGLDPNLVKQAQRGSGWGKEDQARYDALVAKTKSSGGNNNVAKGSGGSSTGMFNFASVMEQFYKWEPGEDDVAGQQLKNTFQGDFIQTVL